MVSTDLRQEINGLAAVTSTIETEVNQNLPLLDSPTIQIESLTGLSNCRMAENLWNLRFGPSRLELTNPLILEIINNSVALQALHLLVLLNVARHHNYKLRWKMKDPNTFFSS